MEVTREELLAWASTPDAAHDLPRLIRRLALETNDRVSDVDFPAGSGVASGGFDGVVRALAETEFVPAGQSVWELSVRERANAKANDDYANRQDTPDGSPTSDSTYVQVICRPWTDRRAWATQRASEGRWKDVRAYNVDTIETWLEQAPTTTAWLAQRMGKPTRGIFAVSDWWDAWQGATAPPMTAELVLSGRAEQVDKLRSLLIGDGHIVTVGGDLRAEELRAVVAAVLAAPDVPEVLEVKTLFVDNEDSFHQLLRHRTATVLIVPDAKWLQGGTGAHHVVVPIPSTGTADIVIPPVSGKAVADALQVAGMHRRDAEELGELARRSLLALRRRLAMRRELHRPSWAGPGAGRIRRRLLLVDRWHENSDGDRNSVSQLLEDTYGAVHEQLTALAAAADDPMVAIVDDIWHIVSPKDAWLLLGGQLTRADMEAFRALALEVVAERDPSFDLPEDERWLAAVRGIRHRCSATLRKGLARTLAKLGAYDETVDTGGGMTGQRWADLIVRDLLDKANSDRSLDIWSSMAASLPLLAEASPTAFMQAVPFSRGHRQIRRGSSTSLGFSWTTAPWSARNSASSGPSLVRTPSW